MDVHGGGDGSQDAGGEEEQDNGGGQGDDVTNTLCEIEEEEEIAQETTGEGSNVEVDAPLWVGEANGGGLIESRVIEVDDVVSPWGDEGGDGDEIGHGSKSGGDQGDCGGGEPPVGRKVILCSSQL